MMVLVVSGRYILQKLLRTRAYDVWDLTSVRELQQGNIIRLIPSSSAVSVKTDVSWNPVRSA